MPSLWVTARDTWISSWTGMNRFPMRECWVVSLMLALSVSAAARQTPLIDSVRNSEIQRVGELLAGGASPDSSQADGTTALHLAVLNDSIQGASLLIDAGARPDAENRLGVTPLYLAATNGNPRMTALLLSAGADPNQVFFEGETALMTAARTGDADTVRLLIEAGADVDAREDWKGQTALMWAAAENNAAAIRVLADAGADVRATSDGGAFTAFLFAVRGGHIEAVEALLEAGADIEGTLPDGMSPLLLAVYNAHYELAAHLLDRGADPNADAQGWTPLHQVVWSRRPNAGFNLPGASATGGLDSLELVRKLVAAGADVNRRLTKEPRDGNRNMLNRIGSTPFLMAAKSADVPLMRLLLDSGADPSITNEDGTTALMVAAGVGIWAPGESPGTHEEALAAVKLALRAGGGAIDAVDDNGETAMHGAVYRGGAVSVIQFLADQGAPLDVVNAKGWTTLVAAEGVEYTPAVLKRYPEAAALLRELMRREGLPVPPPGEAGRTIRDARAEESTSSSAERTHLDGVFTAPQAERGRELYVRTCQSCHFEDLGGDASAPALLGSEFWARWQGSTVNNMVELTRNSMPPEAPRSLGDRAYVDLVAYILQRNGAPEGDFELETDTEALERILLGEAGANP